MKRWVYRASLAGCIAGLVLSGAWLWWRNSNLRAVLYGKEAHMKLAGVRMGLHAYWDTNGHLPDLDSWKEAVVEYSVFEPGKPVFESRETLRNCYAVTFEGSAWTFHGSIPEFRRRGDLPMAICDPDAKLQDDSNGTASIDESGNLEIHDSVGKRIGSLPPEVTITTLYVSGVILRQSVAELSQRWNLDAVGDR
jgi:hypothetical protein